MKRLIATLAVAMLLQSSAAATPKQTPGSQIYVISCRPHVHTAAEAHPWIDPYGTLHARPNPFPYFDAFLAISYQNQAPADATEVDFGLVARGWLVAVARDVGTFSHGTTIDHEFVISREVFPLGTAFPSCAVLRVKYADGTEWVNPSPPAS